MLCYILELIPLTQAVEGLRSGASLPHLFYVWGLAAVAALMASEVFKRKKIVS